MFNRATQSPHFRWIPLAGIALLGWGCADDLGPAPVAVAPLDFAPRFESGAAGIVPIQRARVLVLRSDSVTVAQDTTATIDSTGTVDLAIPVALLAATETFYVTLSLIDATDDTVFTGTSQITATSGSAGGGEPGTPAEIVIRYVGVGADAVGVRIVNQNLGVAFGDTLPLLAEAFDAASSPIPGTPVRFATLPGETGGTFLNATDGRFVAGASADTVQVVAELLTGPADTVAVIVGDPTPTIATVTVTPSTVPVAALHQTVPLTAAAFDGGGAPIGGATFTWASQHPAVAIVDAAGLVTAVGNGTATITATADGVSGTATVTVAQVATQLSFTTGPNAVTASDPLKPMDAIVVTALDANGFAVSDFAGTVTLALGTNPSPGVELVGSLSATAANGVATLSDLVLTLPGDGYTMTASATGLTTATSNPFSVNNNGAYWTNDAGGNWTTAANWHGGTVPTSTDDVFIARSGTYTVTVDAAAAVASINVGAYSGTQTVATGSQTLTVGSGGGDFHPNTVLNNTGTLDVQAGTLILNGTYQHGPSAGLVGSGLVDLRSNDLITDGTIAIASLTVRGALTVGTGTFTAPIVTFFGTDQVIPDGLAYQTIAIGGATATFAGIAPHLTGDLLVFGDGALSISTANVVVDGNTEVGDNGRLYIGLSTSLHVKGNFGTQDQGHLSMGVGDLLDVDGRVTFGGGSTEGLLTGGTINAAGDFTQDATNSATSFAPSAAHTVVLDAVSPVQQVVSFASPGPTQSRFGNLQAGVPFSTHPVRIATDIHILGSVDYTYGNVDEQTGVSSVVTIGQDVTDTCGECGSWSVDNTVLTGTGAQIRAHLDGNLVIAGSAVLNPFGAATGDVTVTGSLDLNGHIFSVDGTFATAGSGTLIMEHPSGNDRLQARGDAVFAGGKSDRLTAGLINVWGDFTQTGDIESFHAGGTHRVNFTGSTPQTVTFSNPGIGVGVPASHFAQVGFNNSLGSVTLGSDMFAHDDLDSFSFSPTTIFGNGYKLAVGGLNVSDLTLDRVLLEWNGDASFPSSGTFTQFTNVTFQNYLPSDIRFEIKHPGAASSFTMGTITFTGTLTGGDTGFYVRATDTAPGGVLLHVIFTWLGDDCSGTFMQSIGPGTTIDNSNCV